MPLQFAQHRMQQARGLARLVQLLVDRLEGHEAVGVGSSEAGRRAAQIDGAEGGQEGAGEAVISGEASGQRRQVVRGRRRLPCGTGGVQVHRIGVEVNARGTDRSARGQLR